MLYKKIHRQYLREFKKGREFRVGDDVYKVNGKPYIKGGYIYSVVSGDNAWPLIPLVDAPKSIYYYPDKGERIDEDYIEWLD